MRKLSKYEMGKHGTQYDFEAPEFLAYGDETGEDYDVFNRAQREAISYDESLAEALQALVLDIYYSNIEWLLGEGKDYYEDVVLPELDEVNRTYIKIKEGLIIVLDEDVDVARLMALDWAVEWGEEHKDEIEAIRNVERLEEALAESKRIAEASISRGVITGNEPRK